MLHGLGRQCQDGSSRCGANLRLQTKECGEADFAASKAQPAEIENAYANHDDKADISNQRLLAGNRTNGTNKASKA